VIKYSLYTAIFFTFFFSISCSKENTIPLDKISTVDTVDNMILMYISANNNLKSDAINSIEKIKEGVKENINNKLLVFLKTSPIDSYLIKIDKRQGVIFTDTIEHYLYQNASDQNFLKKVIQDSRDAVYAKKYGLVLWSHATSWLPSNNTIKTKSFSSDDGLEMDLVNLKNVLPNDFEFILFDACYMGTIEVLYELKDKSKYIIASPSEVLSHSFPYHTSLSLLFGDKYDYILFCEKYIEYYSNLSFLESSATVGLYDCSYFHTLAKVISNKVKESNISIKSLNLTNKDKLNFEKNSPFSVYDLKYSLAPFFKKIDEFESVLNKTIVYKGNTKNFLGKEVGAFSGIGITVTENYSHEEYYTNLLWIKETKLNLYK